MPTSLPAELPDIGGMLVRASAFRARLDAAKENASGRQFAWYPYDSLSNLTTLNEMLTGDRRNLLALAEGAPIADIGCGDGDLAFFLESLGSAVHAIDHPIPNFNSMLGVRALRERLGSGVEIFAADLDSGAALPHPRYGLACMLGVLYHLKNPFGVLEMLSKHCRYCLLSTAVTEFVPRLDGGISQAPLAYLAAAYELNGDPTNFWIPSAAGFRRLLERTNWEICDFAVLPAGNRAGLSPEECIADLRAFCFAKSKFAERPVHILLGRGWHPPEADGWRWTEREFAIRIESAKAANMTRIRLQLYVAEAALKEGPLTLRAIANGVELAPATLGAGSQSFERNFLPFGTAGADVRIDFVLSRAIAPDGNDGRERGVIVAEIEALP